MDAQLGSIQFASQALPDERIAVLEYRVGMLTDALLALMKAHGALLQSLQFAAAQPNGAPN